MINPQSNTGVREKIENILGSNKGHDFVVGNLGSSNCRNCGQSLTIPIWPPECKDKRVDQILALFKKVAYEAVGETIEEILKDKILYIGNEVPDAFTKDKRDKQIYLGYPQQLIDELVEKLDKKLG